MFILIDTFSNAGKSFFPKSKINISIKKKNNIQYSQNLSPDSKQISRESAKFYVSFFHYQYWGNKSFPSSFQCSFMYSCFIFYLFFPWHHDACWLRIHVLHQSSWDNWFEYQNTTLTWAAVDTGCPYRHMGEGMGEPGRHLPNLRSSSVVIFNLLSLSVFVKSRKNIFAYKSVRQKLNLNSASSHSFYFSFIKHSYESNCTSVMSDTSSQDSFMMHEMHCG